MLITTVQDIIDISESLKKMDPNTRIIFRDFDYNEYNIEKEYDILDEDTLISTIEFSIMD